MDKIPNEIVLLIAGECDLKSLLSLYQTCHRFHALFEQQCWYKLSINLTSKLSIVNHSREINMINEPKFTFAIQNGYLDRVLTKVSEINIVDRGTSSNLDCAIDLIKDKTPNLQKMQVCRSLPRNLGSSTEATAKQTAVERLAASKASTNFKLECTLYLCDNRTKFPPLDTVLYNHIRFIDYSLGPRPRTKKVSLLHPFIDQQLPKSLVAAKIYLPGVTSIVGESFAQCKNLQHLDIRLPISLRHQNTLNWIPDTIQSLRIECKGLTYTPDPQQWPLVIRPLTNVQYANLDMNTSAESVACLRLPQLKTVELNRPITQHSRLIRQQLNACLSWSTL